ncbi:MAG: extracellular solute-binding protein [Defluviitaleaceae bacterium]|nr:extracellular solute-binding protein [Defluviitaleaceae bacterium]
MENSNKKLKFVHFTKWRVWAAPTVLMFAFFAASIFTAQAAAPHEFTVTAPQTGEFNITVNYIAQQGGGDIMFDVLVNGESVLNDMPIYFRRTFTDETDYWRFQEGNQMFPTQIEIERATNFTLSHRVDRPLAVNLNSGANTLTFVPIEGNIIINGEPQITPHQPLITYAEYQQLHNGAPRNPGGMITILAQEATYKSSPTLFPLNERSDPLVIPYHPSNIILNSIGGWAWRIPGQRLEWQVEVPQTGLYRIALRYAQRERRGFVTRALTINGEVPFVEAGEIQFEHAPRFDSRFLYNRHTGEEFWFFLEEGMNTIGLDVSMGVMDEINVAAIEALLALNRIYQDIIMITSASPSRHRDYQILSAIPNLRERLWEQSAAVADILAQIDAMDAGFSESNAVLERLRVNIENLAERPDRVAILLQDFQVSIAALSGFVTDAQAQPLLLDVLGIGGESAEVFTPRANFFQNFVHNFRAFLGSFTNNLVFATDVVAEEDATTIEVWLSTGFDTFNTLGRLINEQFAAQHPHIQIDLRLVDAGIIFPASLTGRGPDVVLQAAPATPINFAHRRGAVDLTQFPDFPEIAQRFSPAALETFEFEGNVYALPDQMTFNVMYYRTDIFEELGLQAPNTMDELLAIVPNLQSRFMDIFFTTDPQPILGSAPALGGTTRGLNTVHVGLLHQMGGSVFTENGALTLVADPIGVEAFRFWTNLYTQHNFVVATDAATRFRMGEIPLVVADLGLLNALNASAPEIRGSWAIAPIPGMYLNGEFRRDNVLSVSANFIVGNMVEERGTLNEAWEFLKWFTEDTTQRTFAANVEALWGHNWQYLTANVNAFENLNWQQGVWPVLEESLNWAIAIPQVPGGYIAGRAVNNAFLQTVIDHRNPTDSIFLARDLINTELTVKRREFGLID